MTDMLRERLIATAYQFEHDYPNVIPFAEASRIMQSDKCLGEHEGDCAKAERVYPATCWRCVREQMETQADANLAAVAAWALEPAQVERAADALSSVAIPLPPAGQETTTLQMEMRRLATARARAAIAALFERKTT